jgi:hypothetical protein
LEIEIDELSFSGIENQIPDPNNNKYVIDIIGIIGKEPALFDAITS